MNKEELTINEALKILDEDWDDFNDPDDLPITIKTFLKLCDFKIEPTSDSRPFPKEIFVGE